MCALETQATDCDDGNPCTADACVVGACGHAALEDGIAPAPAQSAGDCRLAICSAGQLMNEADDSDTPADDGDPCTDDMCRDGEPHNVIVAGTPCGTGQACNTAGECEQAIGVRCSTNADCLMGFCVDGVCCETRCDQTCRACNITGTVGACSIVPFLTEDASCTAPANVCNPEGVCKKAAGAACIEDNECASNDCAPHGTRGICAMALAP